jgi:DNA-binding MarR family transcriptional regulator
MKPRDRKPAAPAGAPAGGIRDTGFLLQRAHRRLRAALTDALVPYNLGVGHLGVLGLLHTRGDLSQQQLIGFLEIDKSTMVNLVDELERQGLAERQPAPGDRRAYAVRLTSVGRERLAVIGEAVTRVQDALLSPLSPAERARLNELLWKIAQ